jgi:hypothetical protein
MNGTDGRRRGQTPPPGAETGETVAPERCRRRRTHRYLTSLRVSTETIDPVRDPVTGEAFFHTSEDDTLVDVSRTGLRLRAERAPSVGTRVLVRVHIPNDSPLELVGRARWTRVELEPGSSPQRAVCGVGLEVLGGSRRSLDLYENLLSELDTELRSPVAGGNALG